jgi:p-hydroxybenzoate 3-monooxygenase
MTNGGSLRTQVGIVGAGPAGLMLSHLLHLAGISSIVVENRSREYCESRVRAGLMEHWAAQMLIDTGVGERLKREAMVHDGIYLAFNRAAHRIDFTRLIDKHVYIYDQRDVVTDLIARRIADDGQIVFEVEDTRDADFTSDRPTIDFVHQGKRQQISCDFIAGCDGFHGICRPSLPAGSWTEYDRVYPFGWFGILVESAPSSEELIYAQHERGFALISTRTPQVQRLYFQCDPADHVDNWSDDRIWAELHARVETSDGWKVNEGRIFLKGIIGMRSFVCTTMRHGRLFLAGDASHIVPPTGAKGMNLAVSDVRLLAAGLERFYRQGSDDLLARYTNDALKRIWRAEYFSCWMTRMQHTFAEATPFEREMQRAELENVVGSRALAQALAENYVGAF